MSNLHRRWLNRAIGNRDKLTQWENDFVKSVLNADKKLSNKQASVLNRIIRKVDGIR